MSRPRAALAACALATALLAAPTPPRRGSGALRNPYRGDPEAIAAGASLFLSLCSPCHLPDGRGLIGPSLVDPYWKYGSSDARRFETISRGRPLGMPSWGASLGDRRIWQVLAYLDTLPRSAEPGLGSPRLAQPAPAAAPPASRRTSP